MKIIEVFVLICNIRAQPKLKQEFSHFWTWCGAATGLTIDFRHRSLKNLGGFNGENDRKLWQKLYFEEKISTVKPTTIIWKIPCYETQNRL